MVAVNGKRIAWTVCGLMVLLLAFSPTSNRAICPVFYSDYYAGIAQIGEQQVGRFIIDLSAFANSEKSHLKIQSAMTVDSFGQRAITPMSACGETTYVKAINATSKSEFHVWIGSSRFSGKTNAEKLKRYLEREWRFKQQ